MKKSLLKILYLLLRIINILNFLWFPLLFSTFSIIGLGGENIGDIMLTIYTYIIMPVYIALIIYYIRITDKTIKMIKRYIEYNTISKDETNLLKMFSIVSIIIIFSIVKFGYFLLYGFLITIKLFFNF